MIYDSLTKREKEVVDYVIFGYSNAEIARLLFVCEGRVSAVINSLYGKYEIYEESKRCRLMKKRLEELGIVFTKLILDEKIKTAQKAVF